jgi:transcriptional regulator with XRE-family HTH domain
MARRRISHVEIVRLFANRLREVRLSRGMTQVELAQKAHVPASYVSDLEKAKVAPGIDLVDRLAKSLEISVAELLPPAPAVESETNLRDRAARVCEQLLRRADPDIVVAINSLVALLHELSARRR